MAVKVQSVKDFEAQCNKCKSVLTYQYSDVSEHKTNYDYRGDYDVVRGVKCPVCETIVKHRG